MGLEVLFEGVQNDIDNCHHQSDANSCSAHSNVTFNLQNPVTVKRTTSTAEVDESDAAYFGALVSRQLALVTSTQARQRKRLHINSSLASHTNKH